MRIARVALAFALPWLASLAGAQEQPRPEPVPKEMIAGERLQPPGLGFSIQRPGEGWEWVRAGSGGDSSFSVLTVVFTWAEQKLADRKTFSADDLSVILESMESTLPQIKKAFPEDVRAELRKKLEEDKARFSDPKDRERLGAMVRELSV